MSLIAPAATGAAVRRGLTSTRPDVRGMIFQLLLLASLLFSLAVLAILLLNVLTRAWPVFQTRGIDFLTSPLSSDPAQAGISQGLFGTIVLAVLVPIIAFPFGIATAVYLEEYAPNNRLTRLIQINIRNLAGVPSIVYGLLGLAIFVAFFEAIGWAVAGWTPPPRCGRDAGRAGPADRDHHDSRGAPRGPDHDPRSRLWRRGLTLGGDPQARAAGSRPGHPDRHGAGARPRARRNRTTAPYWRDRRRLLDASGAVDRGHAPRAPTPPCRLTVFQWAKQPQDEFRELAAAAIVVLLAVTLFANAVAILLRNRFERNW